MTVDTKATMPLNISENDRDLNPAKWTKRFSSDKSALEYVRKSGEEGEFDGWL